MTYPSPDPLHGVTLKEIVERLAGHYGWAELARQVPVRCFQNDPSVTSSLKFLRRTPWARAKVEALYLALVRDERET
ncbi:VF530 family protein [Deinococcus sp. MIMF12]|uniref:VF530 family protein n=1 Tax=Deinococcus rhizophilus TaxID=3049544 RepID=A0ABT7JH44_9DEIO|nr:VF530 family protein [Deinococcus rhizophilus]MDL2344384.1 VF530 family protein [Deinococcus rhizophilus]